ncbi:MAG TPA: Fur family transcriptional regulator [Rariglobus sp.]
MPIIPAKRIHATRQRSAISSALDEAKGPLSAEEVWKIARKTKPGLGLRTVFRNLQEQVDEMTLLRVVFPGQPPRYEKPSRQHHPHFVCLGCGAVFDLPGETPDVRTLCTLPAGYKAVGGEVTLFGHCAGCRAGKSGGRRTRR